MAGKFGDEFFFRERIELFHEDDSGRSIVSLLAFGLQFVADLSGADKNAVRCPNFGIRQYILEVLLTEIRDRRRGVWMAQHALRSKDDERFAPVLQGLTAQ